MSHVFFQEFGIHQGQGQEITPEQSKYFRNSLILEIYNNWPFVRWMMDLYRSQELKTVDPLEKDWINFIISNNIDVEKFGKDSELFLNEYIEK